MKQKFIEITTYPIVNNFFYSQNSQAMKNLQIHVGIILSKSNYDEVQVLFQQHFLSVQAWKKRMLHEKCTEN